MRIACPTFAPLVHMHNPRHISILDFRNIAIVLLAANALLLMEVQECPFIGRENNLIENSQSIGLLFASALFVRFRHTGALRTAPLLAWGLALFCFTFFVLELDTRPFGNARLIDLTNGTIRNVWLGGLWVVLGIISLRHVASLWAGGLSWLLSSSGICMLIAGVFWIFSALLEGYGYSNVFGPSFLEELMELNGTLFMVSSALRSANLDSLTAVRPGAMYQGEGSQTR